MKFLILSCNTGGGHNTAALAIKQAAEKMGHEAIFTDFLTLAGKKTSDIISSLYVNTAKYLPLVYIRSERVSAISRGNLPFISIINVSRKSCLNIYGEIISTPLLPRIFLRRRHLLISEEKTFDSLLLSPFQPIIPVSLFGMR